MPRNALANPLEARTTIDSLLGRKIVSIKRITKAKLGGGIQPPYWEARDEDNKVIFALTEFDNCIWDENGNFFQELS